MQSDNLPLIHDDRDYYFGSITQDQTREILESSDFGDYILRDNSQFSGHYTLICRYLCFHLKYYRTIDEGRYLRYKICYDPKENKFTSDLNVCKSLQEIIELIKAKFDTFIKPAPKPIMWAKQDYNKSGFSFKCGDSFQFCVKKGSNYVCLDSSGNKRLIPDTHLDFLKRTPDSCCKYKYKTINFSSDIINRQVKAIKARNPSKFLTDHIEIKIGDLMIVNDVHSKSMLRVTNSSGISGLAPVTYFEQAV